ncbi:MAG: NAD(P)-dependent oxidoreductase [Candidatus Kapabacteria bacterium]|nr:NAD(P)-dependent oxidoreductase [Ignavibacteriota bacterium]MCW5884111.1 NAD(P)-dependent oxidoreductase [Candidatus Kapabacteria bacterium]
MKALVTGATGFIGSHIADKLSSEGFEVRCMVRNPNNIKWLKNKGYEIVEGNFENKENLKIAVEGVDYIFHVAGLNFAKNKKDFQIVNTLGTQMLLNAAYDYNPGLKRFVYMGSQTATGPSPDFEHPVDEESPRNPITSYGLSKKLAEDEVMAFKGKIPYTIIKPPAVFGPRDTAIYGLFKMMYFGFAAHMGMSKKYISLIFVDDLVKGTVQAALCPVAVDNTYFLTNDKFYDWDYISDVFKAQMNKSFYFKVKVPEPVVRAVGISSEFLFGLFGVHPKFDKDKSKDFICQYWTCKADKAKRDFGFKQNYTFNEAVKLTFDWYKENKWL